MARGGGGIPQYATDKAAAVVRAQQKSIEMALGWGIPIVAGTDAGSCGMPHPSLVDEVATLARMGLGPMDALRAATSRAADAIGSPDVAGVLRPGAQANLIVVDGDPLQHVMELQNLVYVMHAGKIVVANAPL